MRGPRKRVHSRVGESDLELDVDDLEPGWKEGREEDIDPETSAQVGTEDILEVLEADEVSRGPQDEGAEAGGWELLKKTEA